MKTAQWIDLLAQGAGPAPQRLVLRRLAPVAVLGALGSAAIAVAWLGGVPAEMFLTAAPWIKLAYAAALAAPAGWLTARLARPVPGWPRRCARWWAWPWRWACWARWPGPPRRRRCGRRR